MFLSRLLQVSLAGDIVKQDTGKLHGLNGGRRPALWGASSGPTIAKSVADAAIRTLAAGLRPGRALEARIQFSRQELNALNNNITSCQNQLYVNPLPGGIDDLAMACFGFLHYYRVMLFMTRRR